MSAPKDQHFLIDRHAIDRIADAVDVSGKRVLEIGPGEGALTRALLARGARVIAVEVDFNLCSELELIFAEEIEDGRLRLICGDILKVALPPFDIVVANLPYSASSKITFRLLDLGFEAAVLMYQKEFARRMIARPGTHEAGRLSVMVQTYARVKPILELPPAAFRPKPQVRSWVVKIVPQEPPFPIRDRKVYADVVRVLFSYRRKTVRRALSSGRDTFSDEVLGRVLAALPDEILAARPENLTLEEFARIAEVVAEHG
ncbi:MAG: 16S ribosomal RNA methyltransferase A [Methanomicrobiaceae archaeon]|uniref:Ssu rrna (Adenine(1518)-n(6)/adenine(1519)-n(6))-dimethyltransferase n=1 Tax=hydrocarbon metagenome TaxID=938273 RepID=A0A0W8FIX1_9ZZZZ|nr:16S ribosomal RNA methyltransferase A [Methanomicrobiaceae archaeon]MDD5420358.1 16S rRNA (adenine(1518)-N(6)/adenine(1519)-N(6))-dimethyltransferase RsmA [Methanomicrobiaceae archaeon]